MNHRHAPVQYPETINQQDPIDLMSPEALDPAAAFALGLWGMTTRLAQPGRPVRRHSGGANRG